ncbi:MAG: FtsQ-type POTRA domain-containing protein [Kiritimatiellae bacterium]|nr:FtsQ-type POTRA domain-containing protein [Kiritimatiellia bacterium]
MSARRTRKKKTRYAHIAGLAAVPISVLIGVFLLWLCIRELGAFLYARSDAFVIRDLQVLATSPRTKALVKDYTQIKEGQNIFGFDIGAVREYVMANSPNFHSMTITRYLPDRVVINVIDRTPLARIGHRGGMVADSEGCVFIARTGTRGLPTISGYDSKDLEPGMQLEGSVLAALQVIEGCDSRQVDMRPLDVDVGDPEKLVLKMEYKDRKREVPLTWNGMGQQTSASLRSLSDTLGFIKQAFDDPKGARLSYLDATIDGRLYGR